MLATYNPSGPEEAIEALSTIQSVIESISDEVIQNFTFDSSSVDNAKVSNDSDMITGLYYIAYRVYLI